MFSGLHHYSLHRSAGHHQSSRLLGTTLLSQTLNTFWVRLNSLECTVFFAQEKLVKWFEEEIHFLKAKDMTFREVSWVWTELRGMIWVWKQLGMGRSYEDKQVQLRKSKFRNTKLISSTDFTGDACFWDWTILTVLSYKPEWSKQEEITGKHSNHFMLIKC